MPRQGPRRLPAAERDRRLAEEVLYLHSLWRRGSPAPAPAPIQSRSDRREQRERSRLNRALRREETGRLMGRLDRALRRKERKRREIDHTAAAAAEPALAPSPPTSSPGILAEAAAGTSAPPTANPPPPTTPRGRITQREAVPVPVPSSVEFTNRDSADYDDDGGPDADRDKDKEEEEEATVYFTGLFERDAWLRGHYTGRWRKGRFQCMVCAAGGSGKVGKAVRRFWGCLTLVHHARDASQGRSLCGRHGRRGAHRALAAVVCRLLGWDIEKLAPLPHIVKNPGATAGVQHAKENDGAGENNCNSTDDDSYSIDEDEESDDEESVDEEEDVETGTTDPGTTGDEDDSEIESNEEYAEKEGADTGAEGSKITNDDTNSIELDNSEKIPEKEAADSIARKRDMKIRDRLLSLTPAKPVGTPPKKTKVQKRSRVPKHKEVWIPGIKFNQGSFNKAKRKASALSYQGLKSSTSGVVKKVKINQQPSNKGKQSKTNETGASARKAKRKAKRQAKKQLAKKRKVDASNS